MAITPRTVLSEPINLVIFALSVFGLIALLGLWASRDASRSTCKEATPAASQATRVDVTDANADWPRNVADEDAGATYASHACQLVEPSQQWGEREWVRHIHCMSVRGQSPARLLAETSAAIEAVGLTPDLAVAKADYLARVSSADRQIDFLEGAVHELGVVDGRLVHRLVRALVWRGHRDDLEQIRHLQLLSRMLLPDSCEVRQTDIWARYMLAEDAVNYPSAVALAGVRRAVESYVDARCPEKRLYHGSLDNLAEVVGVGIAAEASNGHSGHSSLIRRVVQTRTMRIPPAALEATVYRLCRDGVPDGVGLRSGCHKRVGDEIYLAR